MEVFRNLVYSFFLTVSASSVFYTLSLHDALPICKASSKVGWGSDFSTAVWRAGQSRARSEEHTSELQSHVNLVCRLLLEKKKHSHLIHQSRNIKSSPRLQI